MSLEERARAAGRAAAGAREGAIYVSGALDTGALLGRDAEILQRIEQWAQALGTTAESITIGHAKDAPGEGHHGYGVTVTAQFRCDGLLFFASLGSFTLTVYLLDHDFPGDPVVVGDPVTSLDSLARALSKLEQLRSTYQAKHQGRTRWWRRSQA